jgi:NTP pyrophosphatase (non-canonical NTP hydrolase)
MTDADTPISTLQNAIVQFATVRGWEPYHSPKNLVMALASEVGELCDEFRWLTESESRAVPQDPIRREAVADELADVLNIVLLLGAHLGIDLTTATAVKLRKNAIKYPPPMPSGETS